VKRLLLVLALLGTLCFASAAGANTPAPNIDYAKINYYNGTTCASGVCQMVMRIGQNDPWIISTGQNVSYSIPHGGYLIVAPDPYRTVCGFGGCNWMANMFTGHWRPLGNSAYIVTWYARMPCPTPGAYKYSASTRWYIDSQGNNLPGWAGVFTLGSGCQTQSAFGAFLRATQNLTGTYRMAKGGGHARMRNLLKANCFPATDKLSGPWACPERHP